MVVISSVKESSPTVHLAEGSPLRITASHIPSIPYGRGEPRVCQCFLCRDLLVDCRAVVGVSPDLEELAVLSPCLPKDGNLGVSIVP